MKRDVMGELTSIGSRKPETSIAKYYRPPWLAVFYIAMCKNMVYNLYIGWRLNYRQGTLVAIPR